MAEDRIFRAYANLLFEALVVFILPLGFAARELLLLRREQRRAEPPRAPPPQRPPWYRRPVPWSRP
jgi:hypothetical protein